MSSPNSAITAPQQAGNAPIRSGSTTCCATTSPLAFINAQEASCDSRTIVEKPVRNREFCISRTMPERLAFTTSRSTASMCIAYLRHDQVLVLVNPRGLAFVDYGRAVELIENGRSGQGQADVELLALIDRTVDVLAVHAHATRLAQRILERCARRLECGHLHRRHQADAAHAIGHDLDRLLRRMVPEHRLVLGVELLT